MRQSPPPTPGPRQSQQISAGETSRQGSLAAGMAQAEVGLRLRARRAAAEHTPPLPASSTLRPNPTLAWQPRISTLWRGLVFKRLCAVVDPSTSAKTRRAPWAIGSLQSDSDAKAARRRHIGGRRASAFSPIVL
jgi:hypothetical protein